MSIWARVLLVIGSVVLLLGVLAGVVNREVLDGERFAAHVDGIRTDPAVSRQIGIRITDEVTKTAPNLTIARPLIESTSSALVGSSAFGPVIRAAVVPVHSALTTSGNDLVLLRLADVGAVLVAGLSTVAPDAAAALPDGFDVTLADFGGQGFGASTIGYAHFVKVLSWALPLLAILCLAGAALLSRGRASPLRAIGLAVATCGLMLAGAAFVGGLVASRVATDGLRPALGVAVWNELSRPVWTTAAFLAATGYVLAWAGALRPEVGPREPLVRAAEWLRNPPETSRLAHGAVLLAIGVAVLIRPLTALTVLAVSAAFVLAPHGFAEVLVSIPRGSELGTTVSARLKRVFGRPEVRTGILATAAFAVLAGLVAWNARPPQEAVAAIGLATDKTCNGHVELCDRRYDEVAYPSTHNSMSAADEEGWFLADQPTGVLGQLDAGIRVFLIDSWPGQRTQRKGVIASSEDSRAASRAEAREVYGPNVFESAMRLRDASSLTPTGPVEPYLCHAQCELGATKWEPLMAKVKDWMDKHPREVVTFFIQDEVPPADAAKVFEDAGLLPFVFTPERGKPWPTLEEMIDSGDRLVVLAENKGGGASYPWLLQGFDWVQDTPYDAKRQADFSCKLLRGSPESPLFLVNHWLNRPQSRISDATRVNAANVLGPRLDRCRKERGMLPNYVSVDYFDRGALFDEVDRLNGFK